MKNSKQKKTTTTAKGEKSQQSTRWWQMLLLYPTFGVALISAVPDWMEGFDKIANRFINPQAAAETQLIKFMKKNPECVKAPFQWVEGPDNTMVDGTICSKTGDIWLTIQASNGAVYKGIEIDELLTFQESSNLDLFSISAHASIRHETETVTNTSIKNTAETEVAQQFAVVVCQSFEGSKIIRHVKSSDKCYDEVVDAGNGVVISRTSVPCKTSC